MIVEYLDNEKVLQTDTTINKVEPVLNGSHLLITSSVGGDTFVIPIKNVVNITDN